MGIEIERKFLTNTHLKKVLSKLDGESIKQGYLFSSPEKTIRIRTKGEKAFITIKGKSTNISRPEFEYEIPVQEAHQMLYLFASKVIEKTRFEIPFKGYTWEVDVFHGENEGLILAEIELDEEEEEFPLPAWIKEEVTGDTRYYNAYIAENAYKLWKVS